MKRPLSTAAFSSQRFNGRPPVLLLTSIVLPFTWVCGSVASLLLLAYSDAVCGVTKSLQSWCIVQGFSSFHRSVDLQFIKGFSNQEKPNIWPRGTPSECCFFRALRLLTALCEISEEIIKKLIRCTAAPPVAVIRNSRKPPVRPRTPGERLLILHDCFNLLWPVSFKQSAA